MSNLKEKIYEKSPHFIQNCLVTIFNVIAIKKRYSKKYTFFRHHYESMNKLTLEELKSIQSLKYSKFINFVYNNSPFYKNLFIGISDFNKIENISSLPIIKKEEVRSNISNMYTSDIKSGNIFKTGGTTGKSLEVMFTSDDVQERIALLNNFRGNFGYNLGKKTAWFSGKNLISKKDLIRKRFWKTDFIYNVRYYSTFHIHSKYLKFYIENLLKYKPEYLVGFPSTMYEIAKFGILNNVEFPANTVKAIFPTAETITKEIRDTIETFFKSNLYNQYASSEGAPFIYECKNKKLHLELQSGVFEVLDENNNESIEGRLVVTSFTTHGTPLVRYDIGDKITLNNKDICNCGNKNPLVSSILGRVSDYIYSEETGKINLGNISNCLKGVKGIIKFQIQQNIKESIIILIEKDTDQFKEDDEKLFIKNLRERLGDKIKITFNYVDEIPSESSGKYRIVKNSLNI